MSCTERDDVQNAAQPRSRRKVDCDLCSWNGRRDHWKRHAFLDHPTECNLIEVKQQQQQHKLKRQQKLAQQQDWKAKTMKKGNRELAVACVELMGACGSKDCGERD